METNKKTKIIFMLRSNIKLNKSVYADVKSMFLLTIYTFIILVLIINKNLKFY